MVRLAIHYAPDPLDGLLMIKLAAVGLGVYCWKRGRLRLLNRINILFALLVAWNIAALILASASSLSA